MKTQRSSNGKFVKASRIPGRALAARSFPRGPNFVPLRGIQRTLFSFVVIAFLKGGVASGVLLEPREREREREGCETSLRKWHVVIRTAQTVQIVYKTVFSRLRELAPLATRGSQDSKSRNLALFIKQKFALV